MSKGLEALENILNQELIKPDKYRKNIRDIASVGQVTIIQKELEDYEETKQDLEQVMKDYQDLGNSCYKELKALEIIKEMLDNDLSEKLNANSRKIFKDIFNNLPKEKRDLLKEVML